MIQWKSLWDVKILKLNSYLRKFSGVYDGFDGGGEVGLSAEGWGVCGAGHLPEGLMLRVKS